MRSHFRIWGGEGEKVEGGGGEGNVLVRKRGEGRVVGKEEKEKERKEKKRRTRNEPQFLLGEQERNENKLSPHE